MKLQNVPLDQIDWNPWRDKKLNPIDPDHVAALRASIRDHGFFASVKGRRKDGRVQIGCGHARLEAARKATYDGERLETIPIYIDDLDDDQMLRLMVDENALQAGNHAGALIDEVAAVMRRITRGLLEEDDLWTNVHRSMKDAFETKRAFETAQGRLQKRLTDPNASIPIGLNAIQSYFGSSYRPERQIREAISTLKQSGHFDEIVDDELRKHPQPVADAPVSKSKTVQPKKAGKPKRRILDERTATLFPNDTQFHAFREAITTPGAQKIIPVEKQYAIAKGIMTVELVPEGSAARKQISAPYIKKMVHSYVEDGLKQQREIDQDEREKYLFEQREKRIDAELQSASSTIRSLLSAIAKLQDLAREFPSHPKIGGFAARLDTLVGAITEFSKRLK